jgi:hypothetical protein
MVNMANNLPALSVEAPTAFHACFLKDLLRWCSRNFKFNGKKFEYEVLGF